MSAQVSEFASELELALGNRAEFRGIDQESKRYVYTLAYCEYINISVLGVLWFDDAVTEILIDDWNSISVEIGGRLYKTDTAFRDITHAKDVARRLSRAFSDRELTTANPLVTAELPGARVTFAIDTVVKTGISVSIRKFSKLIDMKGLRNVGALSDEMFGFLDLAVAARANVLVSGGTGTGKTTMINALSESIPTNERVITIEDAYELKLATDHWVALQTKEAASGDDTVRVTLADLLVNTLRMRPDRIIVGEIRESRGASVMLQAANTGHDGTMTTIHANSAERAVNFRLSGLIRQASQNMPAEVAAAEVSSALDLVVHVSREKGRRFIKTIAYVDPDLLVGPDIKPMPLFEGQLLADGTVQFQKVADLPETTSLAMKINDFDSETRKTGDK
jgi:pilus assembly protein CpaF